MFIPQSKRDEVSSLFHMTVFILFSLLCSPLCVKHSCAFQAFKFFYWLSFTDSYSNTPDAVLSTLLTFSHLIFTSFRRWVLLMSLFYRWGKLRPRVVTQLAQVCLTPDPQVNHDCLYFLIDGSWTPSSGRVLKIGYIPDSKSYSTE